VTNSLVMAEDVVVEGETVYSVIVGSSVDGLGVDVVSTVSEIFTGSFAVD